MLSTLNYCRIHIFARKGDDDKGFTIMSKISCCNRIQMRVRMEAIACEVAPTIFLRHNWQHEIQMVP